MQTLQSEKYVGATCSNCKLWQIAVYKMGFGYITSCECCGTSFNEVN